jgi:hypothetical protein
VILNKREQLIAWVVGVVVGGAVLFMIVNSVFLSQIQSMSKEKRDQQAQYKSDSYLLDTATVTRDKWEKLGIKTSPAEMGQQVHTTVTSFAQQTGMTISNWTANTVTRPVTKTDYEEATFKAQLKGNSAGFHRFLYALESSRTPMRVDEMAATAQPPGQDSLSVNLTLTALIYAPKAPKGKAIPAAARSTSTKAASTKPGALSAKKESDIARQMAERRKKELNSPATRPANATETTQPTAAPGAAAPAPSEEGIAARMARERQEQLQDLSTPGNTPATAPTGGAK